MPANPRYGTRHQRARAAALAAFTPGQPCTRCAHPLLATDRVDLDHQDGTDRYLGLAHSSPCQTCGARCNQAAGGQRAAQLAGHRLRQRRCVVCGTPYEATSGSSGHAQETCGARRCVRALLAARKARQPDPQPPPVTGRAW